MYCVYLTRQFQYGCFLTHVPRAAENSGYLKHLLPGDVVLADIGFDVADSVALYGATLDIPAFTRCCDQLGPSEVEAIRKLANVRIHMERVIGAMRQRFQVLSSTGVLQKEME